ncbi:hypothetical protein [Lagierella massiliensis]|uniref:hypothetical protein n=1 Tax=Lagierella massiliensis TaxID=1689303 RepID=UPI0006D7E895|nr:hypothetical protein [Lagierella massiliensis]
MKKILNIILVVVTVTYLVLFFLKVPVSQNLFMGLLAVVLIINGFVDYQEYRKTKSKSNLILPIGNLILFLLCALLLIKRII